MSRNMKLFISAQRKIPTSSPRYLYPDWLKLGRIYLTRPYGKSTRWNSLRFFWFFPTPKNTRMCFVSINFLSRNLRQSQTLPQRRTYISFSTFFSVLAFQKTQINVNLFESSSFSYFLQVFPPKGPPRIIQNPNNPNRHKCHYWQSCGISIYQNSCLNPTLRNLIRSCISNLRPFMIVS